MRHKNKQERLQEVVSATQPKSRHKFLIRLPLQPAGPGASPGGSERLEFANECAGVWEVQSELIE